MCIGHMQKLLQHLTYMTYMPKSVEVDLQCQHLNPAPNARAAQALCMTRRSIATQFPWHGCTDDLTNERRFDLQAM